MSTPADLKEILAVGLLRKIAAATQPLAEPPADGFDASGMRKNPDGTISFNKEGFKHVAKKMSTAQLLSLMQQMQAAKKTAAAKHADGEQLGPSRDLQAVGQAQEAAKPKTLQELMGTPDVQKWFRGSVGGLAKRGQIPYALLQPGHEPQTNMQHEELKAILQQILEAKAEKQAAFMGAAKNLVGRFARGGFQQLAGGASKLRSGIQANAKAPADAVQMLGAPNPAALAAAKQRMAALQQRLSSRPRLPMTHRAGTPGPDATLRGGLIS